MRSKIKKETTILKNIYFQISAVIVVIFSAFLAYVLSTKSFTDKWNEKIYPGVIVEGVDLSDKTKEEAIDILNQEFSNKIGNKKINIYVNGQAFIYTYGDILAFYDVEKSAEDAFNFGKDKGIFTKNSLIKNKDNEKHEIKLEFNYDEEKFGKIKGEVANKVRVQPKNAKISINGGNISISKDVIGYKLDEENFEEKLKSSIDPQINNETNVEYSLVEEKPSITYQDLSKIKNKMSTFSTTYTVGDRGYNLELATSLVNGKVLMPGETFSYSEVSQKGRGKYKNAGGYINGKVEQVEAGGICQVSTTLYRAVMKANIRSTERHNHMMTVSYAEPGLDATVAWGNLDYKFKNPYDFPIYIEGIGGGGRVTFNIYGDIAALEGKTYELVGEELGYDSEGNRKVKSYQVTYKNGKEINREVIATDSYRPSNY